MITSFFFILVIILFIFSGRVLTFLGEFVVHDQRPVRSDAVVVLNSGMEYYPRLIEAADLYHKGYAGKILINGNRKTDTLRSLEAKGFQPCCPWYEERLRILELFNVPRKDVITVSAEDAYDTVTEAEVVGKRAIKEGLTRILLTTSKFHTKRAHFIWKKMYKGRLVIIPISAKADPYEPGGWWRQGRQIRWVLAEYGAWVYYYWKSIMEG